MKIIFRKDAIPPIVDMGIPPIPTIDMEANLNQIFEAIKGSIVKPIEHKDLTKYQSLLVKWTVRHFKRKKIKPTKDIVRARLNRYKKLRKYTKATVSKIVQVILKEMSK